jgi:hypothetical protein
MPQNLYVLNDAHEPVLEPDLLTWARWFESGDNRQVGLTELSQGGHVSTIFLGIGHSLGGFPRMFETMVFDPLGHSVEQDRYATWAQAQAGHGRMVEKFRRLL